MYRMINSLLNYYCSLSTPGAGVRGAGRRGGRGRPLLLVVVVVVLLVVVVVVLLLLLIIVIMIIRLLLLSLLLLLISGARATSSAARSWPGATARFRTEMSGLLVAHSSGVYKGGFSKGGFSNVCLIHVLLLLNPPLLNPPLWTPEFVVQHCSSTLNFSHSSYSTPLWNSFGAVLGWFYRLGRETYISQNWLKG